jgi:hypothetical protein
VRGKGATFPTVDPTAEVLYAYDMGFFDKAGLDVTHCAGRRQPQQRALERAHREKNSPLRTAHDLNGLIIATNSLRSTWPRTSSTKRNSRAWRRSSRWIFRRWS